MNICVCGIGRAGQAMISSLIHSDHLITCAMTNPDSKCLGKDVGEVVGTNIIGADVISTNNCLDILRERNTELIINFSGNADIKKLLDISYKANCKLIICTTNHSDDTISYIKNFANENSIGIVYAPNLTLGVNLLIDFVSQLSKMLPDFDFEIVERHSKGKPRVTKTAQIISKAIDRGETHISSVRAGGYVGVHEVTCASENERITIVHESFSRQAFAYGALLAAEFIKDKNGFYLMKDVIREMKENVSGLHSN